jgi:hypothetical protein
MCAGAYGEGGVRGSNRPQGQAWADRVAHPGHRGDWQCFVQAPFSAPPHTLGLTNRALRVNSYLKVMVPKSTNITFWEQQKMGVAMVSKLII